MNESQIGEKEKITILGWEYSSLRSEINVRNASIYQVAAVFAAVMAWMLQQNFGPRAFIAAFLAIAGFGTCVWFLARDSIKASMRVQDLEDEINRRASEKLLIWENELGGYHHGIGNSGFSFDS